MSNSIDYDVALEIASHEAIIRQTYKDSVGKWTWSVGLTSATGHDVERYIDSPQPLERCLAVYVWALNNYAEAVRKAFAGCPLSKAQFAAALSFHWNTGAIGRASWVKHFKAGNLEAAEKSFMEWRNPPEIIERRRKEADLLFRGKWSNDGRMTEYTRLTAKHTPAWGSATRIDVSGPLRAAFVEAELAPPAVDRPPEPDAPVDPAPPPLKPLAKSKEIVTGIAQTAAGGGGILFAFSQLDKWVQLATVGMFAVVLVTGIVVFGNRIWARLKGVR